MTKENVLEKINESKTICSRLMSDRDYKIVEKYIDWLKDYISNSCED